MFFCFSFCFFFFNDTATTEIYTLSLHDALPILVGSGVEMRPDADSVSAPSATSRRTASRTGVIETRSEEHTSELQSRPHISYAVFCLKKKKKKLKYN